MANLSDLVGFALTVKSTRLYEEPGVEGSSPLQRQADFHSEI